MEILKKLQQALEQKQVWEKPVLLKKGDRLCLEGATNTNIYWVESGCIRVFYVDEDKEHSIRFGYAQSFIAALDSFISENTSSFYLEAVKNTTVFPIQKEQYLKFINSSSQYKMWWQEILQSLIYQQLEREIDLLTTSPEERYNRVFKRSPQLFQEAPLKYIASYLRMTPETLSRIRKS